MQSGCSKGNVLKKAAIDNKAFSPHNKKSSSEGADSTSRLSFFKLDK
jgi:hypothetical protein